jgi:cell shape-determining protein MreD
MKIMTRGALRSRAATRIAVAVAYAGLALWSTWPLASAPLTKLPLGTMQMATVPLFNLWTIWWNADRLRHGFRGYWDAPIFHPEHDTFAFSEPQPTTIVVAPVIWLTGSRALAFNAYLWLSLVLNGVFAECLLRRAGVHRLIAIGGGAAMLLLPIVHWQLDVLQLAPIWGILWTWMALLELSRRPSIVRGAIVGVAFAVAFWTCSHQALLLAVLIAGAAWILPRRWLKWSTWPGWIAAAVIAAALVFPIVSRLQYVMAKHEFSRTAELVTQLSAATGDYTAVPGRQLVHLPGVGVRPFWHLSPGWIKLILAAAGVAFGLSRRRWRRWTAFLLVTALVAFLLSLGTNLKIGDWQPWWTLTKFCPGLAQVRNVFRFAFFVQMAVVLLGAQALHGVFLVQRRYCRRRWSRCLATGLLSLLGLAALCETTPETSNMADVPDAAANAGWIDFVRRNTPRGRAVICLPVASSDTAESYVVTTRWMYFGTFHQVPLVDGYSGFFPREHFELRHAINTSLLTEATLLRLIAAQADFLVVRRAEFSVQMPPRAAFGSVSIELVYEDPSGVDIYRLSTSPPA